MLEPNRRHGLAPLVHLAWLALSLPAVSAVSPVKAQPPTSENHDVRRERLTGVSGKTLRALEPYTHLGAVALVEFADSKADRLPAVNLLTQVRASPEHVLRTIENPAQYPGFMKTLDRVEVVKRDSQAVVYDWGWDLGVFRLKGRNIMRSYRSPKGHARGHRVTIDSQSGDFGTGRMTIRILPRPYGSLVVLSLRLDLRRSNYIARQAARAARSVNRSANMALGYTMLMNFKQRAEGEIKPGTPPDKPALSRPPVNERALIPLLERGDIVISHMQGTRLDQTSVFGRVDQDMATVREVMTDAEAFGSALLPGSTAEVVERKSGATIFDWDISIPIIGVSGRMSMHDDAPMLSVEALDGALRGGRWQFHTGALGRHSTLISSWANFDLSESSWLIERIVATDPYLSHGMSAAGEIMLLRAIRSRVRKLMQARAAEAAEHARTRSAGGRKGLADAIKTQ